MKEYIELGPVPSEEKCAQVGDSNYSEQSIKECRAYKNQLKRRFPLADFQIKLFEHDFGYYREVVVYYNDTDYDQEMRAIEIEDNIPEYWDEEAKKELEGK